MFRRRPSLSSGLLQESAEASKSKIQAALEEQQRIKHGLAEQRCGCYIVACQTSAPQWNALSAQLVRGPTYVTLHLGAPFFDCLMQQTAFIALQGELRPGVQRLRGSDAVRLRQHLNKAHTCYLSTRKHALTHVKLLWIISHSPGCLMVSAAAELQYHAARSPLSALRRLTGMFGNPLTQRPLPLTGRSWAAGTPGCSRHLLRPSNKGTDGGGSANLCRHRCMSDAETHVAASEHVIPRPDAFKPYTS